LLIDDNDDDYEEQIDIYVVYSPKTIYVVYSAVLRLQGHVTVKKSHVIVNAEMIVLVRTAVRPSKTLSDWL